MYICTTKVSITTKLARLVINIETRDLFSNCKLTPINYTYTMHIFIGSKKAIWIFNQSCLYVELSSLLFSGPFSLHQYLFFASTVRKQNKCSTLSNPYNSICKIKKYKSLLFLHCKTDCKVNTGFTPSPTVYFTEWKYHHHFIPLPCTTIKYISIYSTFSFNTSLEKTLGH